MILRRIMRFFWVQWYNAGSKLCGARRGHRNPGGTAMCLSNGQYGPHEDGDDPVEHCRLLIKLHDEVLSNQIPHRAEMGTAAFFLRKWL